MLLGKYPKKLDFFPQLVFFPKKLDFVPNFFFGTKSNFLEKNRIFREKSDFVEKIRVCGKYPILWKKSDFFSKKNVGKIRF
jgi:hypothetical protein